MQKKWKAALLVLAVVMTGACKKVEDLVDNTFNSKELMNVSYGSDANNVMDVYLPAGRDESTPVVIFVHGGSWISGDKSEFSAYASLLRRKGFAVVNMNYRLVNASGSIRLAEQRNDLKTAVDYVYSKASEWNVSNKIGLLGASAGAHLSLLYTYKDNSDNKVKTVVSLAGPTNFTDTRNVSLQQATLVQQLVGADFLTNLQPFRDASPIFQVSASSRPTLIFHGRTDTTVPVQQSVDLKAALEAAGVKNKLVIYEGTGHEVINAGNTEAFFAEVESWLRENIR